MAAVAGTAEVATPELAGSRVRLRPLRAEDAGALFRLRSDPRVMRYWSHPPWTEPAQAAEYLAKLLRESDGAHSWAVTHAGADALVGTASLFAISRAHRRAEIGYSLAADLWGRGYAQDALRLVLDFAFMTLGVERVEADVDPRNDRSCRLVERLGFVREGLLRSRWRVGDEVTDSAMYGLLRSVYRG
jgi:RimJ/RimL family protein N-acetyltransferase